MKACVVDDDYTSRVLLKDFLVDEDWEVVEFRHPQKKSEELQTSLAEELNDETTKLLIMDVRFGRDAEGLGLGLKTVKSLVEEGDIRDDFIIIFVSQFGKELIDFSDIEKLFNKHDIKNYWIDKPVDFVFLNEILNIS